MSTTPSLAGVPLKYISLVTLTVQNSMLTILLHYSRTSPDAKPYSAPAAVLLNELLKGFISLSIAIRNSFEVPSTVVPPSISRTNSSGPLGTVSLQNTPGPVGFHVERFAGMKPMGAEEEKIMLAGSGMGRRRSSYGIPEYRWWRTAGGIKRELGGRIVMVVLSVMSRDCWKLSIPAILYVIQNNLQFVAASNLDVASFQVTYQLKILTTALCSVVMLKRRLSAKKWWSLLFLAVGVALVQLQNATSSGAASSAHATGDPLTGFIAVMAACFTSGLAGVYFELVLKGSNVDLWIRNVQLSLFSLLPALAAAFLPDMSLNGSTPAAIRDPSLSSPSLFANFGIWAWATVLTQVLGGLVTALVIKFADNILKGFATSLSIVLSFAAGIILFDFQLSLGFTVGCSVVLGATYMYNQPERKPSLGSPAELANGSVGSHLLFSGKRRSAGHVSPLPLTTKLPLYDAPSSVTSSSSYVTDHEHPATVSSSSKPYFAPSH